MFVSFLLDLSIFCYHIFMSKVKIWLIFSIIIFFAGINIYINSLSYKLNKFLKNKDAQIGIAVIKNNKIWIAGDKKQPLLSVFKYCVALKVLKKLEDEKISLDETITVRKDMIETELYSPMLKKYTTFPFRISIKELLEYSVSQSDNNACDILISYSGGTNELNNFIHNIGFNNIEIFFNEREMNLDIKKQYLNKAYPADIARLMKFIRESDFLSQDSKKFLDVIMFKTTTGEDKLKSGLPKNFIVAHKTGSSSRTSDGIKIADNDAGYVISPDGTSYYIAVMISNSKMSDKDNAGIISEISRVVYEYFY